MSDIISIAPIPGDTATSPEFNFKDMRLNEATKRIRAIYEDASRYAEAKNKEIACILSEVKDQKSYAADGFKSVADYAQQVFGIKRANAYSLASAGSVYNNPETPDIVKSMPPSKVAEISALKAEEVKKAVEDGRIKSTSTQKDLREYAKTVTEAEEASKPSKVLKDYWARIVSPVVLHDFPFTLSEPAPIEIWDDRFTTFINETFSPSRPCESIRISKCAAFKSPLSDTKNVERRIYITENYCLAVEFYIPVRPQVKPLTTAQQKARKSMADMSIEEIRELLAMKEAEARYASMKEAEQNPGVESDYTDADSANTMEGNEQGTEDFQEDTHDMPLSADPNPTVTAKPSSTHRTAKKSSRKASKTAN